MRRDAIPELTFAYASFEELARFWIARERVTMSGVIVTFHSATVCIIPLAGRELIVVTCLFARNQPLIIIAIARIRTGIACVFIEKNIRI